MPILLKTNDPDDRAATLGLWHLTADETVNFFRNSPPPSIQPFFDAFLIKNEEKNSEKQRQSACAEFLTAKLTKFKFYSEKDEFGKPYLVRLSGRKAKFSSSRSHSTDFVAALTHEKGKLVGIDIQKIDQRMFRIMPRLLSEKELNFVKLIENAYNSEDILDVLHIFWGAKEALYKAYGRRGLDFKANIAVDDFFFSSFQPFYPISKPKVKNAAQHWIEGSGSVKIGDFQADFVLKSFKIEDYMLVYCIEK